MHELATQKKRQIASGRPTHPARLRRLLLLLCAGMSLLLLLAGGAYFDQAFVVAVVDGVRDVVGPGPVAQIESWAFQLQDKLHEAEYQSGRHGQVQWVAGATIIQQAAAQTSGPVARTAANARPTPETTALLKATSVPSNTAPSLAWSPYVSAANGQPILERALIAPDAARPYVQAALVRIDLRQAHLHIVAGTQEPRSNVRVSRPGVIPASDRPALLAAFNGGFKAVNGSFGMMVHGTTFLPPQDGLATLALYRDGTVRLGVWGKDISASQDMLAFRQNCPLLVDAGQLTAQAQGDDPALWGKTVGNRIATWRSGLGMSADGRYLIYAVGDGLTVPSLGYALARAGAERGMQLDINSYWTRFVTYSTAGGTHALTAQKLIDAMAGSDNQFLTADERDFFYLTTG